MIAGPIEQKPIYHYYPGMKVLSIGSSGCNLKCEYCQNFEISQVGASAKSKTIAAVDVVKTAIEKGCGGIAFTYSEPFVWYEYVMDVASAARTAGLKTILKTAAYANIEPFCAMLDKMDAVNIDVKGTKRLYKEVVGLEDDRNWTIQPDILHNLREALERCHTEISVIAIPGYWDDVDETDTFFDTLASICGREMPVHLLRFYPDFKMKDARPTTLDDLDALARVASQHLRYVYTDYAGLPTSTFCECGASLVYRDGIEMKMNALIGGKFCPSCWKLHNFIGKTR
jgi:pyruvate formate lyase activating enzyme